MHGSRCSVPVYGNRVVEGRFVSRHGCNLVRRSALPLQLREAVVEYYIVVLPIGIHPERQCKALPSNAVVRNLVARDRAIGMGSAFSLSKISSLLRSGSGPKTAFTTSDAPETDA